MFGLVAHARHSSVKKPLSASRYQANRNVARINCPGNSITIFKSQPIPAIDPFNRKSEYDILVVKTIEAQTHNFLHYKFNDDVLCQNIETLLIHFLGHLPSVHSQSRRIAAVEVQKNHFGVVKTRPVSEPIAEVFRPLNRSQFRWKLHELALNLTCVLDHPSVVFG